MDHENLRIAQPTRLGMRLKLLKPAFDGPLMEISRRFAQVFVIKHGLFNLHNLCITSQCQDQYCKDHTPTPGNCLSQLMGLRPTINN
ncbi:hypothetical protein J6590_004629 [Homalodisca vitripennis]|nr:hypothetical protein J6590_004629 [Homalodisca vitripennis]